MDDCIFCKIVAGEIPCTKIYEDDVVLSFLDIRPLNDGHLLVIPKEHFRNTHETPNEILSHMVVVAKKLSIATQKAVEADGMNIGVNIEAAAGQEVFHTHFHVIPRFEDDGYKMWSRENKDGTDFEAIAQKIKNAL